MVPLVWFLRDFWASRPREARAVTSRPKGDRPERLSRAKEARPPRWSGGLLFWVSFFGRFAKIIKFRIKPFG